MAMDGTAISICLGIGVSVTYSAVRYLRQRTFDLLSTSVIAMAAFAAPACVSCIRAGWSGKAEDLPANWRVYLAFAGLVAAFITLKKLCTGFAEACIRPADQCPEKPVEATRPAAKPSETARNRR